VTTTQLMLPKYTKVVLRVNVYCAVEVAGRTLVKEHARNAVMTVATERITRCVRSLQTALQNSSNDQTPTIALQTAQTILPTT